MNWVYSGSIQAMLSTRNQNRLFIIAVPIVSILLSLITVEVVLNLLRPMDLVPEGISTQDRSGSLFEPDAELGYRPFLTEPDRRQYYRNDFGTVANAYPATKPPGLTRLLFVGDSVTRRGRIIEALKKSLGVRHFEYWNAGVEGYNTTQQLGLYKRWNYKLQAEHVILTLHPNDFMPSITYFRTKEGKLESWHTKKQFSANPWLLTHSEIYKRLKIWQFKNSPDATHHSIIKRITSDINEFNTRVSSYGGRFSVLVLPWIDPDAGFSDMQV